MEENGWTESQQTPVEAASFVEKGSTLTKYGTDGRRRYQRHFFVDRKVMAVCYKGSRKRSQHFADIQIWVPIKNVVELREEEMEESVGQCHQGHSRFPFSIVVGKDTKRIKSLIAPSPEVRDSWMTGLRYFVSTRAVDNPMLQERMWLEEAFAMADRNRDDLLDQEEIVSLMNSLNVAPLESEQIKQQMQSQKLDIEEFLSLYKVLGKKTALEDLFNKYSGDQQYMTVQDLARFFQTEQGEEIPPETLEHIMVSSEPCPEFRERHRLSLTGFNVMFTSPRMNIKNPRCLGVYQDMTQPLSHYLINSSHNTYLEGYQTVGGSEVEQYKRILARGCRCVELDVWDGDDGEPVLFHGICGHTMTSKILLKDVLKAINDVAFEGNDRPVIISLENHASPPQQARMASIIRETFQDRLYVEPLWEGNTRFPSPDQLKGRIIIQGAKLSDPCTTTADESDDEGPEDASETSIAIRQKKKVKVDSTQELANCVSFYQAAPFKSFDESSDKMSFLNISESNVKKCLTKDEGCPFLNFNVQKLSRVYPAWWRVSSTNFNPVPMWMAGCQIVSLNFQTRDESILLNDGLFEDNGRCGYVLKPDFMRTDRAVHQDFSQSSDQEQTLTIKVISGYMIPKDPGDETDIVDPYVQVEIHGAPADKSAARTETVRNNGFNPTWNETKQFTVTCPQLALVLFRVFDKDSWSRDVTVAEYCLPMRCMQTGYRMVALRDSFGERIGPTGLFVHISVDKANV